MSEIASWLTAVESHLVETGYTRQSLQDVAFPETEYIEVPDGTRVPTVHFGDTYDAQRIVSVSTPYFTKLESPHFLLRLVTMQTVLGEDYAVVGTQVFHPSDQPLDKAQQKRVSTGDFSPFADRQAAVLESFDLVDDQAVIVHGQSMSGDVATQLAFNNRFDENRGSLPIVGLGAIEPARTAKRRLGGISMLLAFGKSGGDLAANIVEADTTALHEAWGLQQGATREQAKKIVGKKVNADVVSYVKAGIANNWAAARGFATTESLRQLDLLLKDGAYSVTAVRSKGSAVFTKQAYDDLYSKYPDDLFEVDSDHSRDDNIIKAAQLILHVATRAA